MRFEALRSSDWKVRSSSCRRTIQSRVPVIDTAVVSESPEVSAPRPGARAKSAPAANAARWQTQLGRLAEARGVPGAVLGFRTGDEPPIGLAHGVLSLRTRVEVTPDSVFQLGSLTKIWTATLAVQLAEDGLLDLDRPVASYLDGLRLSDEDATHTVTMRHLLTHTSGIDGDFWHDTGRGDGCLERYVAALAGVPQLFKPGAGFSYSNAGFVLAGRVIEVVGGQSWDRVLQERLIEPLGLTHTSTLPEEAIVWRVAVGHVSGAGGTTEPAPRWVLARSSGPAARVNSTAGEVLAFVQLHLDGGRTAAGSRLLSRDGVHSMQQSFIQVPNSSPPAARGLGWGCAHWGKHRVLQHNGETFGQHAFLRVLPDDRLAFVLLANGGDAGGLFDDVLSELLPELAGFAPPAPVGPFGRSATSPAVPLERYEGRYERLSTSYDVRRCGDRLVMDVTNDGPPEVGQSVHERELVAAGADGLFAYEVPGSGRWSTVLFCTLDGREFLHDGGRAAPKASQERAES